MPCEPYSLTYKMKLTVAVRKQSVRMQGLEMGAPRGTYTESRDYWLL